MELNNDLRKSELKVNPIGYRDHKFKNITIREVYDDNKGSSGICHIKANFNLNLEFIIEFMRKNISSFDIGLVDPEMILKLDYPICAVTEDAMSKEAIFDIFKNIDKSITDVLNKKNFNA